MKSGTSNSSIWMRPILQAAGAYNLAFGAFVILFPNALFQWIGVENPTYPAIWQCVGMVVGVYGVGYLIAAANPFRHWPIVLVGLLGKVLGPLGFIYAAATGQLPWTFGIVNIFNDLIWLLPFASILFGAFSYHNNTASSNHRITFEGVLRSFRSSRGSTLAQLSAEKPLLLIFLRHFGCTFCREALADLRDQREEIENSGVHIALVHMSPPMQAAQALETYDLYDLHRFSDPRCQLYEAFELERGSLMQLFGPKVWWRGLLAGFIGGHGIGMLAGDGFRMPGVFMLDDSKVIYAFHAKSAADRPSYIEFSQCIEKDCEEFEVPSKSEPVATS